MVIHVGVGVWRHLFLLLFFQVLGLFLDLILGTGQPAIRVKVTLSLVLFRFQGRDDLVNQVLKWKRWRH